MTPNESVCLHCTFKRSKQGMNKDEQILFDVFKLT